MAISPNTPQSVPANDDVEDTYDPSEVEVNRGREQGLGVGARDLDLQDDVSKLEPEE